MQRGLQPNKLMRPQRQRLNAEMRAELRAVTAVDARKRAAGKQVANSE